MTTPKLKIGCILLAGAALGACGGKAIDESQGDGDGDTNVGGSYGGGPGGTGGVTGTGGWTGTGGNPGVNCDTYPQACPGTGGAPGIPVGTQAPTFEEYYGEAEDRAMCPYPTGQILHQDVIRPLASEGDQIIFSTLDGVFILEPGATAPQQLSGDISVRTCTVGNDELLCAADTLLLIPLSGGASVSFPYRAGGLGSGGDELFALEPTSQALLVKASDEVDFSPRGPVITSLAPLSTDPLIIGENDTSLFFAQPWYEANHALTSVQKGTGSSEVIVDNAALVSLHADASHLYMVQNEHYELMRYELATGVATSWLSYWHSPVAIVGDTTHVYWSSQSPYFGDGAILRTPKSSPSPSDETKILSKFVGQIESRLVESTNCLFWVLNGNLYATAK